MSEIQYSPDKPKDCKYCYWYEKRKGCTFGEHCYLERRQLRGEHGKLAQVEYVVFEAPRPPLAENPATAKPATADPATENPVTGNPVTEDRAQISTEEQITEKQNTDLSKYRFNSFRDAAEISAEEKRKERETYRQLILSGLEVCDENRHGAAECCHEGG